MRGAAAPCGLVLLLSVSVVKGHKDNKGLCTPTQICAIQGSTVKINCKIHGVEDIIWYTKWSRYPTVDLIKDAKYAGRVTYSCAEQSCTLMIRNLKLTDSAQYSFRFKTDNLYSPRYHEPGVSLSVTNLQVSVSRYNSFQCQNTCQKARPSSYIWYKNGRKISETPYSTYGSSANSYSCAVPGTEDFPSPSVCYPGRSCNKVTYTDRRICVLRGSSVDISCTYSYSDSVESKFWFSPERSRSWLNPSTPEDLSKDSQYSGRVHVLEAERGRSTLRITDLRETDSADYRFKFKTPWFEWGSSLAGTTLTVTDIRVEVLYEKLKCQTSCPLRDGSSYVWFKNGQKINGESFYFYSHQWDITSSFSCAVEGLENFPSPPVCANGESCNRVTYTDRSICAPEGSSVNISCTYNSYKGNVESKFWFRPELSRLPEDLSKDSQYSGRVHVLETERGRSTLRITDLTERDSADYRFKFKTQGFEWGSSLAGTTLTVTAVQVQVTRVITVHPFHTVTELNCHSSCRPIGRFIFVWFQNGEKIQETAFSYTHDFYPGNNITCALRGYEDYRSPSVYTPRAALLSVSPSGEMLEGGSVTLTCSSDANPAANYTWHKENQQLTVKEPQLVFNTIQVSDSGDYYCTAENGLGWRSSNYISINVKYAPKTISVSVSPSGEIVEGSSVTLTCSSDANPAANYTWYKDQKQLQGPEGVYHFSSISSEDRGNYYCKSENKHGQLNSSLLIIDVLYAPKLPSVSVSPSGEIVEGSSVNLTCSSDANPAANYTWYKENEDSPKASGQIFTITDLRPEHSGNYYCEAQNTRGRRNSTLNLTVVAGAWKSAAAGSITAVLLALILLAVFLWIRRDNSFTQQCKCGERPDTRAQLNVGPVYDTPSSAAQRQAAGQQGDLHYASICFSQNQGDVVYSNVRVHPQRETEEEEEEEEDGVEYSAVRFNNASSAPGTRRQEDGNDSCALYSTVNNNKNTP